MINIFEYCDSSNDHITSQRDSSNNNNNNNNDKDLKMFVRLDKA